MITDFNYFQIILSEQTNFSTTLQPVVTGILQMHIPLKLLPELWTESLCLEHLAKACPFI
jgi:hypothetical protein